MVVRVVMVGGRLWVEREEESLLVSILGSLRAQSTDVKWDLGAAPPQLRVPVDLDGFVSVCSRGCGPASLCGAAPEKRVSRYLP